MGKGLVSICPNQVHKCSTGVFKDIHIISHQKMQVKTILRCDCTSISMANIKRKKITFAGEDVTMEPLNIAGGLLKWYKFFGKPIGILVPQHIRQRATLRPSSLLLAPNLRDMETHVHAKSCAQLFTVV